MACDPIEKVFRTKITTRASNPHGLACAKARARWDERAARVHARLWDEAMQWRADTDCGPDCARKGSGQISDADPRPRCYPSANEKRCVCIGYVSVRAWVNCTDAEEGAQLEEGDVEDEEEDD